VRSIEKYYTRTCLIHASNVFLFSNSSRTCPSNAESSPNTSFAAISAIWQSFVPAERPCCRVVSPIDRAKFEDEQRIAHNGGNRLYPTGPLSRQGIRAPSSLLPNSRSASLRRNPGASSSCKRKCAIVIINDSTRTLSSMWLLPHQQSAMHAPVIKQGKRKTRHSS
jgi:hypothetical protein